MPKYFVLVETCRRRRPFATLGLPSVSVPVLSTTIALTFSRVSRASAFFMSTPFLRPVAGADHYRHRRREAESTRAGDDQNRNRRDDRVGETSEYHPDDERDDRDDYHRRNKICRDDVGEPLDRRTASLGLADHFDDLSEQRFTADLSARIVNVRFAVDRAADDLVAGTFFDRHRFAGDHRFVDRSLALDYLAVGRDLFVCLYAQQSPGMYLARDRRFFRAVVIDDGRGFGSESQQFFDRTRRLRTSTQFEHLAEQNERRDDGRDSKYPGTIRCADRPSTAGNSAGTKSAARLSKYAAPVPIAISVNMFGLTFFIDATPAEKTAIRPKARPASRG